MKNRPTIFVDFDDTLVQTKVLFLRFLYESLGVKIEYRDVDYDSTMIGKINFQLSESERMSEQEFHDFVQHEFTISEKWHNELQPIDCATRIIPELANRYQLWIVTARTSGSNTTEQIIEKFFPGCFSGIHFVHRRTSTGHAVFPKRDFIRHFKARKVAFIDDSPTEIRSARGVVPCHLFDYTKSRTVRKDLKPYYSWHEVAECRCFN